MRQAGKEMEAGGAGLQGRRRGEGRNPITVIAEDLAAGVGRRREGALGPARGRGLAGRPGSPALAGPAGPPAQARPATPGPHSLQAVCGHGDGYGAAASLVLHFLFYAPAAGVEEYSDLTYYVR